jgi:DDE family transposase
VLRGLHYLSGALSVSRFNRRLHALADWLPLLLDVLGEVWAKGEAFVIDSMPVPVCRRARAGRCKKVRGAVYCGYCAAKQEQFFGWRLHLIVTPTGMPVSFEVLPASYHDLTLVHELIERMPGERGSTRTRDTTVAMMRR